MEAVVADLLAVHVVGGSVGFPFQPPAACPSWPSTACACITGPQVFRAAVELKLRLLVAECLALLLPRQGRRAGGAGVVEAVVEAMDVLTQVCWWVQLDSPRRRQACVGGGGRSHQLRMRAQPCCPFSASPPTCHCTPDSTPAGHARRRRLLPPALAALLQRGRKGQPWPRVLRRRQQPQRRRRAVSVLHRPHPSLPRA